MIYGEKLMLCEPVRFRCDGCGTVGLTPTLQGTVRRVPHLFNVRKYERNCH